MTKVAVIGAGAAGLAAAIAAASEGAHVKVFEAADRIGSKIPATGNGRCNLTNTDMDPVHYNNPRFVTPTLAAFDAAAIRSWFKDLGLLSVVEREGRVYPLSKSANSVLDVLRMSCSRLGVRIITSSKIRTVREVKADAVVAACGGGSRLLESIGHDTEAFSARLCPLATDKEPIRGLSGVRAQVEISAFKRDGSSNPCAMERGEVLFRDYGISGIATFNISRHVEAGDIVLLDLLPDISVGEVEDLLRYRLERFRGLSVDKQIMYKELMSGMFHTRVNQALLRTLSLKPAMVVDELKLHDLADRIKEMRLEVIGTTCTDHAQVTRGGAALIQFDPVTLESKLVSGVFACGEMLDIDGACGGYNLHWAWASGIVAGKNAALV